HCRPIPRTLASPETGGCTHLVAPMQDTTALLRVVEGFYGAALGLAGWTEALDRFGDAILADHIILNATVPTPFLATARLDERDVERAVSALMSIEYDGPPTSGVREGEAMLR